MERWTQEELEKTDNLTFAIAILNERRNRLNPYSPLSVKLAAAAKELEEIKDEKLRFLSRICSKGAGARKEEKAPRYTVELTSDAFEYPYIIRDNTVPVGKNGEYFSINGTCALFETEEDARECAERLNAEEDLHERA